MSVLRRKILISVTSFAMMGFLFYGVYPRNSVPVSENHTIPVTLIIDAGHGGEDGGTLSVTGIKESNLNLQIALRADDLAALCGLRSVLTRQNDMSLHNSSCRTIAEKKASDLRNRVNLVNSTPDAILVSIHQNHFPQEKYCGAQVFYSASSQSSDFAGHMQEDFRLLDHSNKRQAKPTKGIFLMEHVLCPAVLVECGFLSNYAELQKLQNESYQKKIAATILRTIVQNGNGVIEHEI